MSSEAIPAREPRARVPDERSHSASDDPGPRGQTPSGLAPPARDTPARSPAYDGYLRSLRRRTRSIQLWQLGLVIVFLVLWEVAPRANWINPMLTSYPSAVARTFVVMVEDGTLAKHTWVTFSETVVGFVGGMLIGTPRRHERSCHRTLSGPDVAGRVGAGLCGCCGTSGDGVGCGPAAGALSALPGPEAPSDGCAAFSLADSACFAPSGDWSLC